MTKQIKLSFEYFDTQSGIDNLDIIDTSGNTDDILLESLSGNSIPEDILSTGSQVTLDFSMDTSTDHMGFKMRYEGIVLAEK